MDNNKLLKGINVVELTTFIAAPSAARIMAEFGANVIKVESNLGDNYRLFGHTCYIPASEDENPLWDLINAKKQTIVINLMTEEGQNIMYTLLDKADVFITNAMTSSLYKMHMDYETLSKKFPRLIYGRVTGFGEEGPDANRPGFDSTAFWARSGFLTGLSLDIPNSYPVDIPNGFGDLVTGMNLLAGINAALYAREKTGKGDKISVSLYGSAIWACSVTATSTQDSYKNHYPHNRYNTSPIPSKTKDGKWIIPILAVKYDVLFPRLCKALGREDLINNPHYLNQEDYELSEHKAEFTRIMESIFINKTAGEWKEIFDKEGVIYEILSNLEDVFTDRQADINHYIQDHTMPCGKTIRLAAPPIHSEMNGLPETAVAHLLAEDTKQVLNALGYTENEIEELIKHNIVVTR